MRFFLQICEKQRFQNRGQRDGEGRHQFRKKSPDKLTPEQMPDASGSGWVGSNKGGRKGGAPKSKAEGK